MVRALRWVDVAAAGGLVLLGCVHNFVAAPAMYDAISTDLFWFLSAGLALWFAGAVNFVRQATAARAAILAAAPVNLALFGFVVAFGIHTGEITGVGGLMLVVPAGLETLFSCVQLFAPGSRPAPRPPS